MVKRRHIAGVIIEEILNNMRAGAERLYYTVQVPTVYHVYLHQADYETLLPIEGKIIAEAKQALEDELSAQNLAIQNSATSLLNELKRVWLSVARFFGSRVLPRSDALRYEKGAGDWCITLYPDTANELKAGDILIESELALIPKVELSAGVITKTIRTTRLDGVTKSFEVTSEAHPRLREDGHTTKSQSTWEVTMPSPPAESAAIALIRYQDQKSNWHDYLMQKEKINIGKSKPNAAPSDWVDLTLDFEPDISPLHIQLFFESSRRKFFIKDLSTLGTRVNGRLIRSSIGKKDGRTVDLNEMEELPAFSRISLANKIILDFKSLLTE